MIDERRKVLSLSLKFAASPIGVEARRRLALPAIVRRGHHFTTLRWILAPVWLAPVGYDYPVTIERSGFLDKSALPLVRGILLDTRHVVWPVLRRLFSQTIWWHTGQADRGYSNPQA